MAPGPNISVAVEARLSNVHQWCGACCLHSVVCLWFLQVEGKGGLQHLWHKVRAGGPGVLYHGAAASVAASFVGHYPWFTTVRGAAGFSCFLQLSVRLSASGLHSRLLHWALLF